MKRIAARLIQVGAAIALVPWLTIGWFGATMMSAMDQTPVIVHAGIAAGLIVALIGSTVWLKRNPRP